LRIFSKFAEIKHSDMNFVFISPNFPRNYWNFCDRLQRNGVNVLGVGDEAYDALDQNLKASLTEYYKVDDMEDYDSVFRALAWFSFKYGKIDWVESNNEYWLSRDARLREDFHVTTGVDVAGIRNFQSKALMKKFYAKAGVPSARQVKVPVGARRKALEEFIGEVGYPVIVKPEVGVGAAATYKLSDPGDLDKFLSDKPGVPYVMEEFVVGDIYSYDAIVDSKGDPLFESSAHFPPSVMDIVNEKLDLVYYVLDEVPQQLRERGRATVKAFDVRSRFVHMEFFCLSSSKKGLGKKGDFIGLEVNMRPAGGFTPDMMDYAHYTDVYQIWADMVAYDKRMLPESKSNGFCVYYGRRDFRSYAHGKEDIAAKYGASLMMSERMPEVLAPDMGDYMFTVRTKDLAETEEFIEFASKAK